MKVRLATVAVTAIALASLTACGSSPSDTATPSTQTAVTTVVTVTRAPTTTPLPPATTDEPTSTLQPVTTSPTTPADDAPPDFVGHYQAHDAEMDISREHTGWMDLGDGAANYERWRTAWSSTGDGITLRLVRRDEKRGLGVAGQLVPGTEFAASFTTGQNGTQILHMTKAGDNYVDWCDLNRFGSAYECGA